MSLTVYRISAAGDARSMWYDRDGTFNPIVPEVEAVPMPVDAMRLDKGPNWLSSVDDPALLELWFPGLQNRLAAMGFVTRKFVAQHFIRLPNEIVFDLSTATEVDYIPGLETR